MPLSETTTADTSRFGLKAVLRDFRAERELELPGGVRILRRNSADDETFAEEPSFGGPSLTEFYAISERGGSAEENHVAIEEVIVLLWLFKPGSVWIWMFYRTDGKFGYGSMLPARPMPGNEPYELSTEECNRFEAFASYFADRISAFTEQNKRYLRRALERFEVAATRDRDYLALTDLVIGLEGLLVEKGSDLTYKLALRTAILTGRTDKERLNIFSNMKKAYGFRSSYVHGDDVKVEKIGSLYEDVRRYFTNAVVRFLDLPQDLPAEVGATDRTRRYLDELVLRHGEDLQVDYPEWWNPKDNSAL